MDQCTQECILECILECGGPIQGDLDLE